MYTDQNDPSIFHQPRDATNPVEHARSLWGDFTLNQAFSSVDAYGGSATYEAEGKSYHRSYYGARHDQCHSADAPHPSIKSPSKYTLPIVPIYETMNPSSSVSMVPTDMLAASNLYPQTAMPLTIRHPEFDPQQTRDKNTDWTATVMDDIARLETMTSQQETNRPQQPPLTVPTPPRLHSMQQAKMQQPAPPARPQNVDMKPSKMDLTPPSPLTDLYQATASVHDFIAEDRLKSGAKEVVSLPSGIPSFPSLSVRTPAPRIGHAHPYSSPRLGTTGAANLERRGSRSIRPIVRLKREPFQPPPPSLTTAYLAGLRRPMPLSAIERATEEPYPSSQGLAYPLSIGSSIDGNSAGPNSASTAPASLPSESPRSVASLVPNVIESPTLQRGSLVTSTHREAASNAEEEGSLRLRRWNSGSKQRFTGVAANNERPQTQIRATASRKRADDDIIAVSFRGENDWRRRAVLDNILSAQFLADNVMEPINSGHDDPLTMGMGAEGKSIYAVFLEQTERSQWRCLFGDKDHPCGSHAISFKRLERALDHVRSHLNHRPFVCKGECQKGETW